MSDPGSVTLVAAEVAHIQDYIFSSNRLKENIGASFLVGAATEAWALDAVREVASSSNVSARREILPDWHIEQDSTLNAEVVYSGGGNFVAIFRSEDLARAFSRSLSTRVLLEAPGLHLILHSREHRWSDRSLAEVVRDLQWGSPPSVG
ncbi:MAG: hypothetical protein IPK19_25100 [Chloroflexi bacterium]|nr:hypothetical protein [Chloroflexota bacterium]